MKKQQELPKKAITIDTSKSIRSSQNKIDLAKLDATEESMSYYTYPKEFLKLDLQKIREFLDILDEHYQTLIQQKNTSQAKSVKQRLILLKNLEKEKMKKEAKIIYSNQRELIQDKMKEELDNYTNDANKELENLLQVFTQNENEILKAQKLELNEFKKNFDELYESRRPKPSKDMLNWIKKRDYAVKLNEFDKVEDIDLEIEELQKKEDDKLKKEKGNVLKEELKKIEKNHRDEKNALKKRKDNLINSFNKTKNKIIEQIKKKYETKLKELKNYQSFEMASFDKITKGITKPSSRIQNIVNSTAKYGEEENVENKNEDNNEQEQNKKNNNELYEEEKKEEKEEKEEEENNINKEHEDEINEENEENNDGEVAEEQPIEQEDKNQFNYDNISNEEKNLENNIDENNNEIGE